MRTKPSAESEKPKFRVEGLQISLAPATGANAGALYVKNGDEYFGKIVNGKFIATSLAPADTIAKLREIAVNPRKSAVDYGKKTGICCCCGRTLTDPVSVKNGIGPICEAGWGL